jgi:CheY-like chemotaxis protein
VSRVQKPGDIEPVDTGPPDSQSPERDLAGALHEVSNALTVVLGWLECAREEMALNVDVAKKAVDIATMHAKLGRRVARRAIGAESDAIEDEADLEALVRDVVTGVEREALRRRIALAVGNDPSSRAKIVRAAPSLFQVMTNLLLNAIQMSPDGSTVRVETASNGGDASLAVIDSGPGIDPARWTTIFGGGYTTRSGGAGVGLRHAHALASSHGGKLSLGESMRGARFDVKWPVVALRPPMSRISSMPGLSLDGVHILLLEDDDAVIGLLSTALSLRGATVHAARNTSELEAATKARAFDAALLDLSPIANDVGGALAKVQQRCPKAKLVLISGTAAEVPSAAQGLMSAWIRKPFEVGEILAVLRGFSTATG